MRFVHPVHHDGSETAKEVQKIVMMHFFFPYVREVVESGDVKEIEEQITPVHMRLLGCRRRV